jgi:drug/metabolite transporter (DMT)-like permease
MDNELILRSNSKKKARGILLSDFPKKVGYGKEINTYECKAYYLLFSANFFLGVFFLLTRVLYNSHHKDGGNTNTVNFYLGFYLFILAIILLKIDKIDLSVRKNFNSRETDYLLIRSICGFFANYFAILSLSKIRLISTVTIFTLSPVFSTYMIMKKQREVFKKYDKLSMVFCLVTIVVLLMNYNVLNSDEEGEALKNDYIQGVIYALIATVITSVNNLLDKKINNDFHSYVVLFVIGLYTIIITPIFIFISNEQFVINPVLLSIYLILGASCYFGFYFNYKIIEINPLLVNSPLHFIGIVFSYLYNMMILNEGFSIVDILSGFMVMALNLFSKVRMEECEHEDNL